MRKSVVKNKYQIKADEFEVEIQIDDFNFILLLKTDFNTAPKVFEKSNIICPKNGTRHINGDESFCMVGIMSEINYDFWEIFKGDIDKFIEFYVIPYLEDQLHYDDYGEFQNGEYPHFGEGLITYYYEIIRRKEINLNLRYIIKLLLDYRAGKYPRNYYCLCRSQKKFKNCSCHFDSNRRNKIFGYHKTNFV